MERSSVGVDGVPLQASVPAAVLSEDDKPVQAWIGSEHTCPLSTTCTAYDLPRPSCRLRGARPIGTKPIYLSLYVSASFSLVSMWGEVLPSLPSGINTQPLPTQGLLSSPWTHPSRSSPWLLLLLPERLPL